MVKAVHGQGGPWSSRYDAHTPDQGVLLTIALLWSARQSIHVCNGAQTGVKNYRRTYFSPDWKL